MNKKMQLFIVLITISFTSTIYAEGLGRLFTTPEQRALLEKLRHPSPKPPPVKKYDPIVIVDHSKFKPPKSKYEPLPVVKPEPIKEIVVIPTPQIPKITVNGIVKRSGGRSTAWVNGINTYDGYFDPQHIKVNPRRIGKDHVHVETEDINIGEVSLKVGQTLEPKEGKIVDTYQKMVKENP